jgi:hypothetical protein
MSKFKRLALLAVSALTLTVAVAPAYAGEDGPNDSDPVEAPAPPPAASSGSSGGSSGGNTGTNTGTPGSMGGNDRGIARGGAQTGFGGMAATSQDGTTTAIGLAGGGLLILTAAGLLARRSELEVGA